MLPQECLDRVEVVLESLAENGLVALWIDQPVAALVTDARIPSAALLEREALVVSQTTDSVLPSG